MNKIEKLSDLYGKENELTEEQIDTLIFDEIEDKGYSSKYAIVFGSPDFQNYRVYEAIKLYKEKRIQKIIFSGGIGRETEESKRNETEAVQMKRLALENGVLEEDIILEDKSSTTIENCANIASMLEDELESIEGITLISSVWHLKRCLAIAKKCISSKITYLFAPAEDEIACRDIWKNNEMGRKIIEKEVQLLGKHATQGRIFDLDIDL